MSAGEYRRKLRELCEREGWTIEHTAGGHFRLRHPEVPKTIVCAKSPRHGHRAVANTQAIMRRLYRSAAP